MLSFSTTKVLAILMSLSQYCMKVLLTFRVNMPTPSQYTRIKKMRNKNYLLKRIHPPIIRTTIRNIPVNGLRTSHTMIPTKTPIRNPIKYDKITNKNILPNMIPIAFPKILASTCKHIISLLKKNKSQLFNWFFSY